LIQSNPFFQNNEIKLRFNNDDLGRNILLFNNTLQSWMQTEIVNFDALKKLHKIKLLDNSEEWRNLENIPIRSI
jgi:hypothetical protein